MSDIDLDEARAHAKEYAAALGMAQSGQSLVINAMADEIERLRAEIERWRPRPTSHGGSR